MTAEHKIMKISSRVIFSGNQYLSTMAECPNKAAYQFMDLEQRTAKFFNIPFKMRADPFNLIGSEIVRHKKDW